MSNLVTYALTLWQPWAWAVMRLPSDIAKPVENRDWMPPPKLLGQRIALHGGKAWDDTASAKMLEATGRDLTTLARDRASIHGIETLGQVTQTGILGTVRLVGVVEVRSGLLSLVAGSWGETSLAACEPWFVGRYGWLFDRRQVLAEPIPCRGMQKLWRVPADIAARLA